MRIIIFFFVLLSTLQYSTLNAQNNNSLMEERTETSSAIFEGRVIHQESFWNTENKRIFTENRIEVFKVFKGNDVDTISVITQGGLVDGQFQTVSHAIELNLFEEGLFFCKSYNISNVPSETIMLNGVNGYVKYYFNSRDFKAADQSYTYSNIKKELYEPIQSFTNVNVLFKKNNFFETTIENWLEQTLTFSTVTDTLIVFTFENINLIGTDEIEFDIMARSNTDGIKFAASDVYISYDTDAFGSSVVANDRISASKETIIENNVYTLELTDENVDIVKFLVSTGVDINQLYPLSQIAEKFIHVNLSVENIIELASLSFDESLMDNQSLFYNEETGEFVTFDQIRVDDAILPFDVPIIIGFAPNPITAGTGSELTITGTNFGIPKGKVRFPNADDGGMTMMEADDADVVWSDTEIVVQIPSVRNGVGQKGNPAGSGIFQVETVAGDIFQNDPPLLPLDIKYAVANYRPTPSAARIHMAGLNDVNGYTFTFGSFLSNTPNATNTVIQALCDWNDETEINWTTSSSTTTIPTDDGTDLINTIFLGDETKFVGSSAGATAFTVLTGATCQDLAGLTYFLILKTLIL